MSNNQLAGFPAFGPRVDTSITYNPVSYIPESPIELPTSEPATAQLQFTINTASLPTWSPVYPNMATDDFAFVDKYVIYTIAGFYNGGAASGNIWARFKYANPSSFQGADAGTIGAGKYKTMSMHTSITNLALNDVHEVKLHRTGSSTSISLLWAYCIVIPYKLLRTTLTPDNSKLIDLQIGASASSWIGAASIDAPDGSKVKTYGVNTTLHTGTNYVASITSSPINYGLYLGNATGRNVISGPSPPIVSSTTFIQWSADQTSDNKRHVQPYYPTRIAYTPIL